MRVLFIMAYPGYLRYFGSTVKLLTDRGHDVTLVFDSLKKQSEGLAALEGASNRIKVRGKHWPARNDVWRFLARRVRGLTDYLRYLEPRFQDAPYLRNRMAKVLPPTFKFLSRVQALPSWIVRLFLGGLSVCESAIPSSARVEAFIKSEAPDVVVVTPLVNPASMQVDLVKAAQALGIRTCVCIASWDHLTTKGLMRILPDRVAVWNETQKQEAEKFHGAPPARIIVTGAQAFDDWFEREVNIAYDEFCKSVGLNPSRPFVLFVGSTASISAPDTEVKFVRQWIAALRAGGSRALSEIGILVRPHPYNSGHWKHADLSDFANVAIWPRNGANPAAAKDRADYFASLHHSAAVVGINTSAMIEAAIVGRPVLTILTPEFQDTQSGTIHFQYLLSANGGCTQVAASLDEHVRQLSQAVNGGGAVPPGSRFVATFVRPRGVDAPCTPILVEAIEELGRLPRPLPRRMSWVLRPLRRALLILARRIQSRALSANSSSLNTQESLQ